MALIIPIIPPAITCNGVWHLSPKYWYVPNLEKVTKNAKVISRIINRFLLFLDKVYLSRDIIINVAKNQINCECPEGNPIIWSNFKS